MQSRISIHNEHVVCYVKGVGSNLNEKKCGQKTKFMLISKISFHNENVKLLAKICLLTGHCHIEETNLINMQSKIFRL